MKIADHIIQHLAAQGIDTAFVVYGAANGDLIDAFTRIDHIKYVCVMHEQAGGFAAEGYAKVRGVPGLAIATSGPGGQNFVTSIANCYYDSVPCVFITGQVSSLFRRQSDELRQLGFQETPIVDIVRPITKYAVTLSVADARYELEKALHLCQAGRPGPVLLDIPIDVQRTKISWDQLIGYTPLYTEAPRYDTDRAIEDFLDHFLTAQRPVILVGGGVTDHVALEALLEALKVPAFPTWNALDAVTNDSPYYGGRIGTYGGAGRNFAVQNSDLLLAIGCRLSGRITGGKPETFARGARRYVVDVDPGLLDSRNQPQPFHVNILCDAAEFCDRLRGAYHGRGSMFYAKPDQPPLPGHSAWLRRALEWRDRYDPVKPEFFNTDAVHPYAFARRLSQLVEHNAVIVTDCGGNVVTMNHAFQTRRGQRYFSNNGNSPMGFSFAGALGAWFADPTRQVVCVIGDGGFCVNLQELQTMATYQIGVKVFIIDNRIYGITKAYQETNFQGRCEACGPKGYVPPDFVRVAQSFNIPVTVIEDGYLISTGISAALRTAGPLICVVRCPEFHTYEPRIFGWSTPIEDMYPYLPRDEFAANMIVPKLPGWEKPPLPDSDKPKPVIAGTLGFTGPSTLSIGSAASTIRSASLTEFNPVKR